AWKIENDTLEENRLTIAANRRRTYRFAGRTHPDEGGKFHPRSHAEDARTGRWISGRSPALQAGSPGFKSQPVHSPRGSRQVPRSPSSVRTLVEFPVSLRTGSDALEKASGSRGAQTIFVPSTRN